MLFDSHAHLNDARFDEDREALIQKLQEEHVDLVLNPCLLYTSYIQEQEKHQT